MHNLDINSHSKQNSNIFSLLVCIVFLLILLFFVPFQNWGLTILAFLVLAGLFKLFGLNSILSCALMASGFQWLQAGMDIFRANTAGISLNEFTGLPYHAEACALSLLGVLAFACGIRVGYGLNPLPKFSSALDNLVMLSPRKVAITSVVVLLLSFLQPVLVRLLPNLSQAFLVILVFKEALIFLLTLTVFSTIRGFVWLSIVIGTNILIGLFSYFSTFKFSFYWLILSILTIKTFSQTKRILILSLLLSITLIFGLYWTSIKVQQRAFLNQGSSQQVIQVSWQQGLNNIFSLVNKTSFKDIYTASDKLAQRIGYTRFFAIVIDREHNLMNPKGEIIWWQAIEHILVPRILDPNKAALDDSAQTNLYTGLGVAGVDQGTSISLGYITESYIDFGSWGMFFPIFILGWLYGKFFGILTTNKFPQPLGFACACIIVVIAGSAIETSAVKHLGGLVVRYLSTVAVLVFYGRKIMVFLSQPSAYLPYTYSQQRTELDRFIK
ncbi:MULTISPECIES: hypothetical protein [Calothrix]|uniref:Uncharacterized protein n=2 Tax=Calothrix TaxID=1186 RepID=A0ABR8A468_9CYAN|nr:MULTISPECIES: hypothetical protein [Calothrix]MBD2193882.1 hypothetical protein [Calothrix parietina FACHB-288]MBD2222888.1 hypothetical protein [Calothrix anomala FACHB-343]